MSDDQKSPHEEWYTADSVPELTYTFSDYIRSPLTVDRRLEEHRFYMPKSYRLNPDVDWTPNDVKLILQAMDIYVMDNAHNFEQLKHLLLIPKENDNV